MRKSACLAVFLALVLVYPALAVGLEPEVHMMPADVGEPSFKDVRNRIESLFRAYEHIDFPKIRSLMVIDNLKYIPAFRKQIEDLIPEDSSKIHSFKFLGDPKVYIDRGEHGTSDIMADVELCDTITYRYGATGHYGLDGSGSKVFYLFYHFHFDRKSGLFNSLSPAYVKESNCAP